MTAAILMDCNDIRPFGSIGFTPGGFSSGPLVARVLEEARHPPARGQTVQWRLLPGAGRENLRTARVKAAARGRVDGRGDIPCQDDAAASAGGIRNRNGGQ